MSWIIFATAILLGLMAGSFLNVVIHRGPAMWGLAGEDRLSRGSFIAPRSRCISCKSPIRVADLFPIASYLSLRGRCRTCDAKIPVRYPIVELAGAIAAAITLAAFGLSWSALFGVIFLLSLVALAAIDFETGYLPDALTLPLIGLGLAVNIVGRFAPFAEALIGAIAGYAAFAAIAWGYRRIRGRDGLGGGDAKLLAAAGAWLGWQALAPLVFIASISALSAMAVTHLRGQAMAPETAVRFGPALCGGAVVIFLGAAFGLLPARLG